MTYNYELGASMVHDGHLHLILLPTERCNFRCTYCYEDFAIGHMKREVVQGVKAFLDRRVSKLTSLRIGWFGGEPLLAKRAVLEISRHAASLKERFPELRYQAEMTTNAYLLTPELLGQLSEAGVQQYQISLDGPRDIHDRTRRRIDGRGTFDRIWRNLLHIKSSKLPVQVQIRIHYDSHKAKHMEPLLDDIREQLLVDERFDAFFKELEALGGPNDDRLIQLGPAEEKRLLPRLRARLFTEQRLIEKSKQQAAPMVCYAAKANSLLVRADGRLGKCTVAFNDERNTVGRLLRNGRLDIDQDRWWYWLRGLTDLNPDIIACPWHEHDQEASPA